MAEGRGLFPAYFLPISNPGHPLPCRAVAAQRRARLAFSPRETRRGAKRLRVRGSNPRRGTKKETQPWLCLFFGASLLRKLILRGN